MKRFLLIFALAWSLPASADEPHLDFLGLSKGVTDGGGGIVTMHRLCQATFPGSRMCTSRDILLSIAPPALGRSDSGWVQPVFVPYHSEPGVFDISGVGHITELQEKLGVDFTTPRHLSCFGWSRGSGDLSGLTLSGGIGDGGYSIIQCSFQQRVACCGQRDRRDLRPVPGRDPEGRAADD